MVRLCTLALVSALCCVPARADGLPRVPIDEPTHIALALRPLDSGVRARDAALQDIFAAASAQERRRRIFGSLLLVAGAALTTVGSIYPSDAGPFFWPLGARALLRGIFSFALIDDPRPVRRDYERMPATTPEQLATRVAHGEEQLAHGARQYRRVRIAGAATAIVTAAAYVPLGYAMARRDTPGYRWGEEVGDYLLLGLAATDVTFAILDLFTPSGFESAHQAYRTRFTAPTLSLAPTPTGATFTLTHPF